MHVIFHDNGVNLTNIEVVWEGGIKTAELFGCVPCKANKVKCATTMLHDLDENHYERKNVLRGVLGLSHSKGILNGLTLTIPSSDRVNIGCSHNGGKERLQPVLQRKISSNMSLLKSSAHPTRVADDFDGTVRRSRYRRSPWPDMQNLWVVTSHTLPFGRTQRLRHVRDHYWRGKT